MKSNSSALSYANLPYAFNKLLLISKLTICLLEVSNFLKTLSNLYSLRLLDSYFTLISWNSF